MREIEHCTQKGASSLNLDGRFQRINQIGALPAETAVCVRRAAKVAVGSCALINGFVQTQMHADAAWS